MTCSYIFTLKVCGKCKDLHKRYFKGKIHISCAPVVKNNFSFRRPRPGIPVCGAFGCADPSFHQYDEPKSHSSLLYHTNHSVDQCSDHCTNPMIHDCGEPKTRQSLFHHIDESLDQCSDHCTDLKTHPCGEPKGSETRSQ